MQLKGATVISENSFRWLFNTGKIAEGKTALKEFCDGAEFEYQGNGSNRGS